MRRASRQIKAFVQERNAMLMLCDVDAMLAFRAKHGLTMPSCRETAEVSLHKTITGVQSLPIEFRRASKRWLEERGYHALDDGDL